MKNKKCWKCKKVLPEDDLLTKEFGICETCARNQSKEGETEKMDWLFEAD